MSLLLPQTGGAAQRHHFHDLRVSHREQLTEGAVALTFDVPDELASLFLRFEAGQHLTLRAEIGGEDVRQSYSLCLSPDRARRMQAVRVGVGQVPGGRMSSYLNFVVGVGDTLAVMPPLGSFTVPSDPGAAKHHCLIAAGSGITPVLSHVENILTREPLSRVTLFFGNRATADVMFLEELEDLKNAHMGRFQLVHVLSREPQAVELLSGRMDPARLDRLFQAFAPVGSVDEYYLCGPFGMVEGAQELLASLGVDHAHVHHEVFHVPVDGLPVPAVAAEDVAADAVVTVTLDGRTSRIEMHDSAESILAATLRVRPDAPYSCTGGVCGTCRARVVAGEVRMDRSYALEADEIAAGMVLACQSHPVTDEVTLTYDE
ncbi:2Fe-2S iron-sulfur cluster-binding protein [Nostocoides sp. F2B08]|uniref:2Fe-2S iron-sulfur cluster-binding protein n=1 Tax=Nostocoides sp. F2B08 TaxID=2653936 RepID=UPI001D042284|nr:2Fe-2S iron-sulfur cluster-binding protein [Tetrasphaera sp. F2B08]